MKPWLARGLLFAMFATALWYSTVFVARTWVLDPAATPTQIEQGQHVAIEALVVQTLVPAALSEADLIREEIEERSDDQGTWNAHFAAWKLKEGESPLRTALRIQQLAEEIAPDTNVYVTTRNELDVDLRIYVSKRQTHHLQLIPSLSEKVPPQTGEPSRIAVVVTGLGSDGPLGQKILEHTLPLTISMLPYRPFTLRQSRLATVNHKEIILELPEDPITNEEMLDALLAVPQATGILINQLPESLPVSHLLDAGLYVLDATGEVEGTVLRTAKHAGVSVLRTVDTLQGDVEEALLRLQHLSRSEQGLVVTVNASDSACDQVLEWLANTNPSEIRPAYLTEVLDVH
ncbi:MAG: divergent polysaccharide deacetylase family protein [Myxococcota bacterium]|nr:divergent polysaccharide deacetylase family protein [Myxococcota bacterium]